MIPQAIKTVNCLACKKPFDNEGGCVSICCNCGAKADARRAMLTWFITKKKLESKLMDYFKNQKNTKSRNEATSYEGMIANKLDEPYYKDKLEDCIKFGKEKYGLIKGAHYGEGTVVSLSKQDIQDFYKAFNHEINLIKDNPSYAYKIYHYNQFTTWDNFNDRFDFLGEMIDSKS